MLVKKGFELHIALSSWPKTVLGVGETARRPQPPSSFHYRTLSVTWQLQFMVASAAPSPASFPGTELHGYHSDPTDGRVG